MKFWIINIAIILLLGSCTQTPEKELETETKSPPLRSNSIHRSSSGFKIKFTLKCSIRDPYHEVSISIESHEEGAKVNLNCDPMKYDGKKWISNPLDTMYLISKKEYYQITRSIRSIDGGKMLPYFNTTGRDGTICTLEYGTFQNSIKISVWSPDYDTEERALDEFLDDCERIMKSAKLNPKEIL